MPAKNDLVKLSLHVRLQNADQEVLDQTTRDLLYELQGLDIESAKLVPEISNQQKTKGIDPTFLGAIAIATLPAFVPTLIQFIQTWTMRGEGRTIKIKVQVDKRSIEVEYNPTKTSPEELTKLINTISDKLNKK